MLYLYLFPIVWVFKGKALDRVIFNSVKTKKFTEHIFDYFVYFHFFFSTNFIRHSTFLKKKASQEDLNLQYLCSCKVQTVMRRVSEWISLLFRTRSLKSFWKQRQARNRSYTARWRYFCLLLCLVEWILTKKFEEIWISKEHWECRTREWKLYKGNLKTSWN